MADWPDLDDYKAWARIGSVATPDNRDDDAITTTLAAVRSATEVRCSTYLATLADPAVIPADVAEAQLLWTNRLLARRNSPDGVVGVADLGIATVRTMDRDIAQQLNPYMNMVLA